MNKPSPILAMRFHDPADAEKIREAARKAGVSTNAFLQQAALREAARMEAA